MMCFRLALATALAAPLCLTAVQAHAATPISDEVCNRDATMQVLNATPPLEARAVWLDSSTLYWPGQQDAPAGTRYQLRAAYNAPAGEADDSQWLAIANEPLPLAWRARFGYLGPGARLTLPALTPAQMRRLHQGRLQLLRVAPDGRVAATTATQIAGALDDLYADAEKSTALGVTIATPPDGASTRMALWAPTAQQVALCLYPDARATGKLLPMQRDDATGIWSHVAAGDLSGRYYSYVVDVFAPGSGWVRNRVTDPYSLSLSADSRRSYVARLSDARLKPPGWDTTPAPRTVRGNTDMVIYELHVRDFSIGDATVPAAHRGKYLAFTDRDSNGMRHLRALAAAGLTDLHLLPIFDIASIPERGCVTPDIAGSGADEAPQAAVMAVAAKDCFNWGYDPLHYTAPEGSYASNADDGATRVIELRAMVQALHANGLRVGMDVVYNHTPASGQHVHSVLDRIVPGYYQRLEADGRVATSTCCANTATENRMMGKLLIDSVVTWARDYGIDSFRYDLMGHQPRDLMERARDAARNATGHDVQFIGEGWNFGEIADGARFTQAAQLALAGSGIGTFSDRTRDAVRGGSAANQGAELVSRQGYVNGLGYAPNDSTRRDANTTATRQALQRTADLVRVGLAGTLADYPLETWSGEVKPMARIDYAGQPAGYAAAPGEVVNYVENHDNQTLYDINVLRLPRTTPTDERARVQLLAAAVTAFSQGVAYFHAGIDTLRSKSLDRNSYDSGDWFNRLDWTYTTNNFGVGLPPANDNRNDWPLLRPLLADPALKPRAQDIAWMRDAFRDLLAIRASSSLFRLDTANAVRQRLRFFNTGPDQQATVIAAHLDGRSLDGANARHLVVLINVDTEMHEVADKALRDENFALHPVHLHANAADARARNARYDKARGAFSVPARTAVVFVAN